MVLKMMATLRKQIPPMTPASTGCGSSSGSCVRDGYTSIPATHRAPHQAGTAPLVSPASWGHSKASALAPAGLLCPWALWAPGEGMLWSLRLKPRQIWGCCLSFSLGGSALSMTPI